MARVLIVGCGCRGQALAAALVERGHAVRGSSRSGARSEAIEAAGAQAVAADPDRLATLLPHIEGVSVLCWLMGSADGEAEAVAALHGARLESLVEHLVDTPVRGVVYEEPVDPRLRERGEAVLSRAHQTYRMPTERVRQDPDDRSAWLRAAVAAVDRVLSA